MTAEKLHDAISLLPADLIVQTDQKRMAPRPKTLRWQRYAAMAACFGIIAFSGLWCISHPQPTLEEAAYDMAMAPMAVSADSGTGELMESAQRSLGGISVSLNGSSCFLTPEDESCVLDMLRNLSYDPNALCNCIAPITVTVSETEFYAIHLEEGYVRCNDGQAILSREQLDTLSRIFARASVE